MRNRSVLLPAAALVLVLSGTAASCDGTSSGSADAKPSATAATPTAAPATATAAPITMAGDNITQTVNCKGGSIVISGRNNSLKLRGTCPTATVAGSNNTVVVDNATDLIVQGENNIVTAGTVAAIRTDNAQNVTVSWVESPDGREPDVSGSGSNNSVSKITRQEFQSARDE